MGFQMGLKKATQLHTTLLEWKGYISPYSFKFYVLDYFILHIMKKKDQEQDSFTHGL